jgi:hypothetical protein
LEGRHACGAIDLSSWNRVKNTEEVMAGILVRDDSVIDEQQVTGVVAPPDKKINPNAYSADEVKEILKGAKKGLIETANKFTHHFPARHFLETATEIGFNDANKLNVLKERYRYLFIKFKTKLLNRHDLMTACELNEISFDNLSVNEMVEKIVSIEVKNSGFDLDGLS